MELVTTQMEGAAAAAPQCSSTASTCSRGHRWRAACQPETLSRSRRSRSTGACGAQSEPPVLEDLWGCVRLFFFLGFLTFFPFFFFSFSFLFFFLLLWWCLDEEEAEELSESEEVVS